MWIEKAPEYLHNAGFTDGPVRELPHDRQDYYYVCRP
jgi:hypothetical protein